jgi:hypothetical protein
MGRKPRMDLAATPVVAATREAAATDTVSLGPQAGSQRVGGMACAEPT